MVSVVEEEVFQCIKDKTCFVVDAGAGSGKTWALVQALNYVIDKKSMDLKDNGQRVVCITYTNIAKDEIIERIEHNEMIHVSTIHDFLWECIKRFQKELKEIFVELLESKLSKVKEELSEKKRKDTKIYRQLSDRQDRYLEAIKTLKENRIQITYDNYSSYKNGKFSHNDLIVIAEKIFSLYSKLGKIVSDAYPIIFVDEYQDTQEATISILLNHLKENESLVLGFFGDKRQQIYDTGIGEISSEFELKVIKKKENFRSSKEVIGLLNKLRDDIQQFQPPSNTRRGEALFFYQSEAESFNAKEFVEIHLKERWGLTSSEDVKTLYLTHRFIAKENNYEKIYQVHSKKSDVITKNKDNRGISPFTDFLFDTEEIADLYQTGKIQQMLSKTSFEVTSFESKKKLNKILKQLIEKRQRCKISEIIKFVIDSKLLAEKEKMKNYDFEDEGKKEFYDKLMDIEYSQFIRLYQVQQNNTPFSTKHNTKGDEFDHVLAVIDDKAWKQSYNFNDYFAGNNENEDRLLRTSNLFYVICSRAKNNLAILCTSKLEDPAQNKIKEWFSEEKYIEVAQN